MQGKPGLGCSGAAYLRLCEAKKSIFATNGTFCKIKFFFFSQKDQMGKEKAEPSPPRVQKKKRRD